MQTYREKLVGEEIEDGRPLHSLCLSIRDLLLEQVCADIEEGTPALAEISERLKAEVSVYPMTKRDAFTFVAGADAGSQVLPLASRRYAVISALAYALPSGSRFFLCLQGQ